MKKNLNVLLSSISLFVTAFLLIISIFSWYVTNDKASARGIIGQAQGISGVFDIYYFNDTSTQEGKSGNWVKYQNELSIIDAWPNDVFYFKIVGTNLKTDQTLKIAFKDIQSVLNTEIVTAEKVGTNYNILYSGIKRYTSTTTNVSVDYNNVNKTLYNITTDDDNNYVVNLADIKIQDVFKLYTAPTFETVGSVTDFPKSKGSTVVDIESEIFNQKITAADNGTKSIYFALSFNSTGSDTLDNYYQFQGLNISKIGITLG